MDSSRVLLKDADDEGFLSSEEIKSEEDTPGIMLSAAAAEMLIPPTMNSHEMSVIPRDDKMFMLLVMESSWTYMVRSKGGTIK